MSNQYNGLLVADIHRATNSETLDAEKNFALSLRVAAGDQGAREAMINGNMPLVLSKVESFIGCFPHVAHLRDDLVSAASVGLVKAVNKISLGKGPRKKDPSAPTDFIGMWINRELNQLLENEGIVPPHTTKYRARAQGEEVTLPTFTNAVPERFAAPSYQKQLEARDLLESCCTCEAERTIVAMQIAGHTLMKTAKAIGKSRMTTHRMQKKLYARINRKAEALRDE